MKTRKVKKKKRLRYLELRITVLIIPSPLSCWRSIRRVCAIDFYYMYFDLKKAGLKRCINYTYF